MFEAKEGEAWEATSAGVWGAALHCCSACAMLSALAGMPKRCWDNVGQCSVVPVDQSAHWHSLVLVQPAFVSNLLTLLPAPSLACICPAFYLNTTGHKIMLSDLKAKAGTTCCYKVAPINDRILYLSTKNAYASGDAECKSLWTVATYPLSFTHIWLCGCPGGDCAQSKKLSSTIGGESG